ncbi:MAG: hypothetical protein JWN40_3541 [Phycisphaerales bacterium]|nr:hypothetical protein [Phycisphaerales bacterium]
MGKGIRLLVGWVRVSATNPVHAKQLSRQVPFCINRDMYPLRLPCKISVEGANNDPAMLGRFSMQSDEVLAIERQNGSALASGKSEDLFIGRRLIGLSGLLNGYDVMAQPPQLVHYRYREFSFE